MATTASATKGVVSLERALSKLGLASRSEARALILAGRVSVDGRRATDPARRLAPERVRIAIDGVAPAAAAPRTILLHKPRGYVTTRSDPEGRKTVFDLITDLETRVMPVGRLDLATSGLLLLTSDTQFGNWLTDPGSGVPRVYLVTVGGRIGAESIAALERGVISKGERLAADAVVLRKASARESHLTITLTGGKNREIRRLLAAVGHEVTRLRRVQVGGLALGPLAPGQWRPLSAEELRTAFPGYHPRRRTPRPK